MGSLIYINQYYEKNLDTSEETSHYFLGGRQVAFKVGNDLRYPLDDHLFSSVGSVDASGTVVSTVKYFPFGGTRSQTGDLGFDKMFTGQRLDETGLYFYNARYYDATIGRFISPDTIVPNPMNPQSLNRYSYCLNNPLKYIDPSGHQVEYMTEEAAHDYVVSYQATGGLDLWGALELYAALTGTLPEGYYSTQGHTMSAEVRSAWVGAWDYQVHLEHNPGDTAGAIDEAIEVSEATYINLGGGDLDIIGAMRDGLGLIKDGLQALDRQVRGDIADGLRTIADIVRDVTAKDSLLVKYDPLGDETHAAGQWVADRLDNEAERCENNFTEFVALNAPVPGNWVVQVVVRIARETYKQIFD